MSLRTFAAIGALAIGPAFAATTINETRPLSADGVVHISNLKGRIVVRTWAQPQVRITGSLGKGVEKLAIDGDARSLDIEVRYPNHNGGWKLWGKDSSTEPTLLEVTIPQRASLDIESVSADVDVQQMAGRKLSVASVSGAVLVTASSPGEAHFENVSGDTTLKVTSNDVQAESVSGDIRLQGGLAGDVQLESVSGNLDLTAQALRELQVSTVSGDATVRAGLKPSGSIRGETLSGTLELRLPRSTSARLHMESFSGDLSSPSGKVDREEYGPGKSLDTTLGGGEGRITLETFSGNVKLQLE